MKNFITMLVIGAGIALPPATVHSDCIAPSSMSDFSIAGPLANEVVYKVLEQAASEFYPQVKLTYDDLVRMYHKGDCTLEEEQIGVYKVVVPGFAIAVAIAGL